MTQPTIKQLEAFCTTAALGSFSAASESLHTTQSAISKRIAELEAALSVELFERSQKRPALTARGRALLPIAEQVLALLDRIDKEVLDPDPFSGTLRLGVTEISALTWLPRFIECIRDKYPRMVIEPEVDASETLLERLDSNALDMVVVPGGGANLAGYQGAAVGSVRIAWLSSPARFARSQRISPQELADHPLLLIGSSSTVSGLQDAWLRQHGIPTRFASRSNNLPVQGQLTLAGLGISLLPIEFFHEEIARGQLVVLEVDDIPRITYHALYRGARVAPLAQVAALIKRLCEFRRPAG
ncbi:LysR family transcriptional regulator [Burkholderia sp. Ac-20379]|uniref:LysR family transcriptional regulator n=1 Tax=Burkholderia sp. Ac-20379 TaxID=2703900 RepID=UPI0019802FAD|nr:LysR family transcriptional regulator [Burkholderia sp. Ac-20379]MBN3724811.1 LysR family transcriptional regulator [Burkholderia sp. Ac-20379]